MFCKNKELEKELIVPDPKLFIGEPELSAGKVFWKVYKRTYRKTWKFMAGSGMMYQYIDYTDETLNYLESKEQAEKYIIKLHIPDKDKVPKLLEELDFCLNHLSENYHPESMVCDVLKKCKQNLTNKE